MNSLPPGFLPTPTPVASTLVAITVLVLPAGSRDRYRDELRAELVCLPVRRQIAEAAGVLAGSIALRSALQGGEDIRPSAVGRRWSCRIGRHRYRLVGDDNPENRRNMHKECSDCAKLVELKEYRPHDGSGMAGHTGF